MFPSGTVLADKYRVDGMLGEGGMGVVVAATHLGLGHAVAIKVLLPELMANAAIVERFAREARASAKLRGEHVCRVSDVGVLGSGAPYIVMELLHGRDLGSMLRERGPLPVPLAVDYLLQACLGIAEAHAYGIVHRDLKSANVFVTQRPDGSALVKVLDFGIAKAPGEAGDHSLTTTQAVMGSPSYMSPEQMRATRDVDARSDLWSLGVMLFELVTGRVPFAAESITALAVMVTTEPTPSLVADGHAELDGVLARALAKSPAGRFQDIAQLARALAPFGGPTAHDTANAVARVLSPQPPTIIAHVGGAPGSGSSGSVPVTIPHPTTLATGAGGRVTLQPARRPGMVVYAVVGLALAGVAASIVGLAIEGGRTSTRASSVPPAVVPPAVVLPAVVLPALPLDAAALDAPVPPDAAIAPDAASARAPAKTQKHHDHQRPHPGDQEDIGATRN